jgi:hypothetical protein
MFDDHMTWLAAKKASCRTVVEIWHRARKHIANLAAYHGYLPSFHWSQSEVAKYELSQLVHDHSIAQAADTDGRTVRQERHSLSPEQLQLLYIYAMSLSAAECALLLAFCGIMGQSLARSGQICKMNRVHISYSEANLPVTPLFGPVRMLHLGDRGHHKVNKTADMAHWVMRTMKPSLACPWFGLALKTALDAKQRQGAQYEELLSQRTGGPVANGVVCFVTYFGSACFGHGHHHDAHALSCVQCRYWRGCQSMCTRPSLWIRSCTGWHLCCLHQSCWRQTH